MVDIHNDVSSVDFSDTLRSYLEPDLPEYAQGILLQRCKKSIVKYYYRYAEAWGTPNAIVRKTYSSEIKYALLGGLDHVANSRVSTNPDSLGEKLTQDPQLHLFLESATIDTAKVRANEPVILTYLYLHEMAHTIGIKLTVNYSDESVAEIVKPGILLNQFDKIYINCGYTQLNLESLDPEKTVIGYSVQVVDELNAGLSAIKHFLVDRSFKRYSRYFVFADSVGGFKTLTCVGEQSSEFDLLTESADQKLPFNYKLSQAQKIDFNIELKRVEQVATGFKKRTEIHALADFFVSNYKYRYINKECIPISVTSRNIKKYKDRDNLPAIKFEYSSAYVDRLYSEDSSEDLGYNETAQPDSDYYIPDQFGSSRSGGNNPDHNHDNLYYRKTESDDRFAAFEHQHWFNELVGVMSPDQDYKTGIAAGTYNQVTVTEEGRVIAGVNIPYITFAQGDTRYLQLTDPRIVKWEASIDQVFADGRYSQLGHTHTIDAILAAGNTTTRSLTIGDLVINGNIIHNGSVYESNAEQVNIEDNLLLINKNEVGPGVTARYGGIEVERGTAINYQFVFDEFDDAFKIGEIGNLQKVATREDTPLSGGFARWNAAAFRFDAVDIKQYAFANTPTGTITDWNTLPYEGLMHGTNTAINGPAAGFFTAFNIRSDNNNTFSNIIGVDNNSKDWYTRSQQTGVWGNWRKFWDSGNSNLATVDWKAKKLLVNGATDDSISHLIVSGGINALWYRSVNLPDANAPIAFVAGTSLSNSYSIINSSGSTNFPYTAGGGFAYDRVADYSSTSAIGSFKLWTSAAADTDFQFKKLTAPNTWSGWYKFYHNGNDGLLFKDRTNGSTFLADLNNGNGIGTYAWNLGSATNAPTANAGALINIPYNYNSLGQPVAANSWSHQLAFPQVGGSGDMYYRYYNGTAYSTWSKFWHSGNSNLSTVDWLARAVISDRAPGSGSFVMRNGSGVTMWNLYGINTQTGSNNVGYDFAVLRYNDTGTGILNALVIKRDTGYLGIGTNAPAYTLDVQGRISANSEMFVFKGGTVNGNANAEFIDVIWNTSGTTIGILAGSIGTNAAFRPLGIYGHNGTTTKTYASFGDGETTIYGNVLASAILLTQAAIPGTVIDFNIGGNQYKSISANTTFTLSNAADRKNVTIEIKNTATFAITIAITGVKFPSIANLTISANKAAIISLIQINSTVYGAIITDY